MFFSPSCKARPIATVAAPKAVISEAMLKPNVPITAIITSTLIPILTNECAKLSTVSPTFARFKAFEVIFAIIPESHIPTISITIAPRRCGKKSPSRFTAISINFSNVVFI